MGQQNPYSKRLEENIVAILYIYGAGAIFLLFAITKTLNISNMKYKWAHINQYATQKINQTLYWTTISIINKTGEKQLWRFFAYMELNPFSTIL